MGPRLKICCIRSRTEAEMAVAFGASALGLVSDMPSGPGVIPERLIAEIAEIADAVPPPVATFLLTCQTDADAIIGQQRRCRVNTLQLVDEAPPGTPFQIRRALPGVRIVQVVHITGPASVDQAFRVAHEVDALLLDSGDPSLPVKELGGTARVHDWSLSKRIVCECSKPVFLAGGLTPTNVRDAIASVQPYGLDMCSGVRTEGALDGDKLSDYVTAAASVGS